MKMFDLLTKPLVVGVVQWVSYSRTRNLVNVYMCSMVPLLL